MAAETNMTMTTDLAKVQSIDFVTRFNGGIKKLVEALGITRKMPLSSGMVIKTYKAVKDLKRDKVNEGEVIPLSKMQTKPDQTLEITFDKYRKAVTAEAIQRSGFEKAVTETDDLMLREIQRDVRTKLFAFLGTGTGSGRAATLQGALAQAWGKVQTLFEDDGVTTLAFVNPMDVANYIGSANVTTQTAFGMTFITGFTGVTMITNTNVPQGKIYATAPENLVLAYVTIGGGELGKAFSFTVDETGLIGVTHTTVNQSLTYETVGLSGILLFAERLDGVVVIDIVPTAPADSGATK